MLLALGVILLCGFAGVNLANYFTSRESVRQAIIHSELPLTSNNIYSEIQTTLVRPIYVSSLMANDTFLKDWVLGGEKDQSQIKKYLAEIKRKYGVFSTFVVSDITHRYYYSGGVLKIISPKVPKDSWFFTMKAYPKDYRVDVDTNEAHGNELTIFINHKLYDYNDRFIGVTGLGLNAFSVAELLNKYMLRYHRTIYFVNREGIIESAVQEHVVGKENIRQMPGISQVADQLLAGQRGSLEYSLDHDEILLNYRFIPELNWYLVVEQSQRAALQPFRKALYINIGMSLIITLLVLLLSGYTVNTFQRKLERLARTDKLTGLLNRQYFDTMFENAIKVAARRGSPLSIIIFDVDGLKMINDRYGHVVGDAMIRGVAAAAGGGIRGSDILSRWGGDEFVVLLPDCVYDNAVGIARILRQRVAEEVTLPETGIAVSVSTGVAQYREGDTYTTLLDRADADLYREKAERGTEVVVPSAAAGALSGRQ